MGRFNEISKTLNDFFNQFCNAYPKGNVPKCASRPYLTYTVEDVSYFEDNIIQVMIYSDSTSLVEVSNITDKIEKSIADGITINNAGSSFQTIYLRKGNTFAQYMNDEKTECSVYINIISKIL